MKSGHVKLEESDDSEIEDLTPNGAEKGGVAREGSSHHERIIGPFKLAMIAYFLTCGGPFGIEVAAVIILGCF